MSLYSKWDKKAYQIDNQSEYDTFWGEYLPKEAKFYEYLLENHKEILKGTVKEIAEKFEVDALTVIGFLDGINTSLVSELDMESLEEETLLALEIDFEKLYFNMLAAKADWLYEMGHWDNIITTEKRQQIKKEYNKTRTVVNENKIGRNDLCSCGSGKKYKKCCGK
ncbi:SEC-C metal-binding domain-containing protein [Proteocatella sphenisci]|uniref:SEC-C metal-binding domain-containing protein n=1 Tax=Proteocatella sphenisci TaxID=181070 RepID=UPI00048A98F8|nr:SEC-C metal-binding domain-containing protein [Proteocatella sphenisci]